MKVALKILNGGHAGETLKIRSQEFLIGRSEGCHLRLLSDRISRKHCVIKIHDSKVYVRDLNSRNGTFINDDRIQDKRQLDFGDRLKVGALEFEVLIDHQIGGIKKPVVQGLKDAVARSAGTKAATEYTENADDAVSSWLEEADEIDRERGTNDPHGRRFEVEETSRINVSKSHSDTISGALADEDTKVQEKPEESVAAQSDESDSATSKEPGKLPKIPTAKDSQDAASQALKAFFNRR